MKKKYLPIILIMLLSFGLHLFFLVEHPGFFDKYGSRDAGEYDKMAQRLVYDGYYGYNADQPNAYVTPSHPIYLAGNILLADFLHIDHLFLVKISNMILNMLALFALYLTAKMLFKNEWMACLTALLYGTYLAPLHFFRSLLTESPAINFFIFSIFCYVLAVKKNQWRYHVLFGIIASITLMFRPTPAPILLLVWLILIFQFGWKKAIQIGFIWCVGPLIVMLPWVIRNYIQFQHAFLFSSHSGNPLLGGTNPFFLEDFDGILARLNELGITDKEYAIRRIKNGFTENFPLWFSWFTVGKFAVMFHQAEPIGNYYNFFSPMVKKLINFQHLLIVVGAFAFGFIYHKNRSILVLLIIILIYIGLSNLFIPVGRYGAFIIPVMCLVVSYGIVTSVEMLVGKLRFKRA
ncbi:hypothetical protein J2S13_001659 [Oikeobacillus pervagus]|uniref:Glycosyltransferase RgtA/B/C/D-like domain-containing protein n=2 Tax=Oikeobacillus pervagus TaxID=1325931 RepID=A0AAJ1T3I8_9BACI|nr:hypothetical protein [Oikeobacillus pervagus]